MVPDPRFRPAPRRPDTVALVWIAGLALAVIAYAIGPDRVVSGALDVFQNAGAWVDALVHNFTLATLQGLRAVALGLFGTYVGLSLLGIRRRAQGAGGLIVVAILFLLLVWGAEGANPTSNARWAAALIVAAVAALGATRRLTLPPGPPRA
ncbi:MAG TPA: hypothetical protein VFN46_00685 [Acetobacteraceae bacterium]|nr:hypothetical protein [Acetobacteraceae bacterium]